VIISDKLLACSSSQLMLPSSLRPVEEIVTTVASCKMRPCAVMGLVEILLFAYAKGDDDVDVQITLAEVQVILGNRGAIWRDENLDDAVFDFVAQFVGLGFIEGDNEIAQAIGGLFNGLFGLQEFDGVGDGTAEDGRGVLVQLVERQCQTDTGRQLIDGRVGTDRN